jgi:hypothetical protein
VSLRKRRETAARAGLVIGALAEAFPRAFSIYERRRVPLALGIHTALLVAAAPAIMAGTDSVKDIRPALRRYVTSKNSRAWFASAGVTVPTTLPARSTRAAPARRQAAFTQSAAVDGVFVLVARVRGVS